MTRKLNNLALAACLLLAGCAGFGLGDVLQAPEFSAAPGRTAELRLIGPSSQSPLGGAAIRVWAHVRNPNPLGLSLSALEGALALEGTRAANVSFPLGVPLLANQDTVIPLDLTIRFSDLPGLADVAARLLTRSQVAYQLDGTVTVDAGVLGQPRFGPSTLLRGELVVRR
ncbi:MAG: LEA type 2 family protein [Gemmatimonadota bacterium]